MTGSTEVAWETQLATSRWYNIAALADLLAGNLHVRTRNPNPNPKLALHRYTPRKDRLHIETSISYVFIVFMRRRPCRLVVMPPVALYDLLSDCVHRQFVVRVKTVAVGGNKTFVRMSHEHELEVILQSVVDLARVVLTQTSYNIIHDELSDIVEYRTRIILIRLADIALNTK